MACSKLYFSSLQRSCATPQVLSIIRTEEAPAWVDVVQSYTGKYKRSLRLWPKSLHICNLVHYISTLSHVIWPSSKSKMYALYSAIWTMEHKSTLHSHSAVLCFWYMLKLVMRNCTCQWRWLTSVWNLNFQSTQTGSKTDGEKWRIRENFYQAQWAHAQTVPIVICDDYLHLKNIYIYNY